MTAPTEIQHFLIVYYKPGRELVSCTSFSDSREALTRRFEMERLFSDHPELEIVVLSARDRATIERTHSRYFVKRQPRIQTLNPHIREG